MIELVGALVGLVVPPLSKVVKADKTASKVICNDSNLPAVIDSANASPLMNNIRSMVRPALTIMAMGIIGYGVVTGTPIEEETKASLYMIISSWFGSRISGN